MGMLKFNSPTVSNLVKSLKVAIREFPVFTVGFIPEGADVDVYYRRTKKEGGGFIYRLYRCLLANGGCDVTSILFNMPAPLTSSFDSDYDLGEYMQFYGKICVNLETFARLSCSGRMASKKVPMDYRWKVTENLLHAILDRRETIPVDLQVFLERYEPVADPLADKALRRLIKGYLTIYDNLFVSGKHITEATHNSLPTTNVETLVTQIYSFLTHPSMNYGSSVFFCEGLPYDIKENQHMVSKNLVDMYMVGVDVDRHLTIPTHVTVPPIANSVTIRPFKIDKVYRRRLNLLIPYSAQSRLNGRGRSRTVDLLVTTRDFVICAKSDFVTDFIFVGLVRG